eukprot:scaffold18347_cov128-Isochrysis_galbana.AAC.3
MCFCRWIYLEGGAEERRPKASCPSIRDHCGRRGYRCVPRSIWSILTPEQQSFHAEALWNSFVGYVPLPSSRICERVGAAQNSICGDESVPGRPSAARYLVLLNVFMRLQGSPFRR